VIIRAFGFSLASRQSRRGSAPHPPHPRPCSVRLRAAGRHNAARECRRATGRVPPAELAAFFTRALVMPVLFHDINVRRDDFGYGGFGPSCASNTRRFDFVHGRRLGVLAVGGDPPAPVAALCKLTDPAGIAMIRTRFARLGEHWWIDTRGRLPARSLSQHVAASDAQAEQWRTDSRGRATRPSSCGLSLGSVLRRRTSCGPNWHSAARRRSSCRRSWGSAAPRRSDCGPRWHVAPASRTGRAIPRSTPGRISESCPQDLTFLRAAPFHFSRPRRRTCRPRVRMVRHLMCQPPRKALYSPYGRARR
jgi:hypothetical protein